MNSGDEVEIDDTSNGKTLKGVVRKVEGQRVEVYVTRFGNFMWFDRGKTDKGRFKLKDSKR